MKNLISLALILMFCNVASAEAPASEVCHVVTFNTPEGKNYAKDMVNYVSELEVHNTFVVKEGDVYKLYVPLFGSRTFNSGMIAKMKEFGEAITKLEMEKATKVSTKPKEFVTHSKVMNCSKMKEAPKLPPEPKYFEPVNEDGTAV